MVIGLAVSYDGRSRHGLPYATPTFAWRSRDTAPRRSKIERLNVTKESHETFCSLSIDDYDSGGLRSDPAVYRATNPGRRYSRNQPDAQPRQQDHTNTL